MFSVEFYRTGFSQQQQRVWVLLRGVPIGGGSGISWSLMMMTAMITWASLSETAAVIGPPPRTQTHGRGFVCKGDVPVCWYSLFRSWKATGTGRGQYIVVANVRYGEASRVTADSRVREIINRSARYDFVDCLKGFYIDSTMESRQILCNCTSASCTIVIV